MDDLTNEEKAAIAALKRLAARWPKSLWLFSASGTLHVMRCGPNGERMTNDLSGMDADYCLGSIDIPNDGGDW